MSVIFKRPGDEEDDEGIELPMHHCPFVFKKTLSELMGIDSKSFLYIIDEQGEIVFAMKTEEYAFHFEKPGVYFVRTDSDMYIDSVLEKYWTKTFSLYGSLCNPHHFLSVMKKVATKDVINLIASCKMAKRVFEKNQSQFCFPVKKELYLENHPYYDRTDGFFYDEWYFPEHYAMKVFKHVMRKFLESFDLSNDLNNIRPFNLLATFGDSNSFEDFVNILQRAKLRCKTLFVSEIEREHALPIIHNVHSPKVVVYNTKNTKTRITAEDLMTFRPREELCICSAEFDFLSPSELTGTKNIFDVVCRFKYFRARFSQESDSTILYSFAKAFTKFQGSNLGKNEITSFHFTRFGQIPWSAMETLPEQWNLDFRRVDSDSWGLKNTNGRTMLCIFLFFRSKLIVMFGLLKNDTEEEITRLSSKFQCKHKEWADGSL